MSDIKKLLFIILFLFSCGNYVSIEQEAEKNSSYSLDLSNRTCEIQTQVWIRNWISFSKDLPYWEYIKTTVADFDSLKKIEYEKAVVYRDSLLKLYDLRDGFFGR